MPHENAFAGLDRAKDYRLAQFNRPCFTQAELVIAVGLPEKTLQNYFARYEKEMHLSAPAPGKGQRRLYSAGDAVLLAAMKAVAGFGLAPLAAVLFGNHVRAWAIIKAPLHYEAGFVGLPTQFFGFCARSEQNQSELMVQGGTYEEIRTWAEEYGHQAILIIDGKRVAQDVTSKLWARYELVRIEKPEDWEKARFKPAEE